MRPNLKIVGGEDEVEPATFVCISVTGDPPEQPVRWANRLCRNGIEESILLTATPLVPGGRYEVFVQAVQP